MPSRVGQSRGSQLLAEWRGETTQTKAAELLGLDSASYSRFENGVRKPTGEVGFLIEQATDGKVYANSWYEPPARVGRKRKAS